MGDKFLRTESEHFWHLVRSEDGVTPVDQATSIDVSKRLANDDSNCLGQCPNGMMGRNKGDGTCECVKDGKVVKTKAQSPNPFIKELLRSLREGENICTFEELDVASFMTARLELAVMHQEFAESLLLQAEELKARSDLESVYKAVEAIRVEDRIMAIPLMDRAVKLGKGRL